MRGLDSITGPADLKVPFALDWLCHLAWFAFIGGALPRVTAVTRRVAWLQAASLWLLLVAVAAARTVFA